MTAGARPIVLATGGTGGHVFPAEALAGELETRGMPFELITDSRGRQWQGALARRPIHYIRSASPSGSLGRRLRALPELALGFAQAWRLLGRIAPAAVVGFGGYATVPTLMAARMRRLPIMLHEQNAVLGKANRLALSAAARIATSFAETKFVAPGDSRNALVGNPVREPIRAMRGTAYRAPAAGRVIDLLVFGGSQGAAVFSQIVPRAILALPVDLRSRLRLVQQCRHEDLQAVRTSYAQGGVVAETAPFFKDMAQRLAAAHLVIARSGSSSVSELGTIGRPSILVPYPHAVDDHQTANARAFEAAGACMVIPQPDFTAERLARDLTSLFEAPDRLAGMAAAAHRAGRPDAAARLADIVADLTSAPAFATPGVAA